TASDGARTTYLYNEENLLSRIKYADGAVVRYTYDANGNRIGEEDENGAKTTFVYDALGRAVEVTGEEGLHYAYRYDGEGNLIEAEDALGNTVSMEYDGNGNLVKETNALGESRHYTYTPLGDVESITDEAGRTTCYQYQKGGLLEKIQYSDGTEEAFTYDANGNLETHTLATGFVLRYGYDSMDRITEITGSEGEKKSYTYDALGNVTSMTDGEGNTTRYAYTLSGQLAKVTDALGNETQYRYDACDRLIEICQYGEKADQEFLEAEERNRRGRRCQVTRYHRDIRGQITEVTDAMGQKETYTYDKKGQLLGKLDKEGYLTKYAYTKQGDLSGIQYADGREVKLSYNPLRQLTEIQDWLGSTKITPDALGRAEKVQYPDGREVSYTYGKAGERRSLTYPDGKTVFYGYDEQFRLSELKEGDSIITYGYDPVGRLCEKQFPNGTKTTYRYDRKDQVTELVHRDKEGILDRYTYLYDLLGNKTGITKERRGLEQESGSYTYGYDALGRLSEIQKDGKVQTQYGYDAFGNRIWKEESRERTSYQYNDLNQMVSERQGEIRKEYGYDKRGNLTSILENGTWKKQYVYGAINRLEEAVDAAGKQARYQYNGLGHRVGKQEGVLPKEKLEKLDPQRRIGMEIGNSRQITYALDLTRQYHNLLERTEESKSQRYFWDGNVAAYEENGERNYYLQDELGSPLRIEDSAGTLLESYGYGAFGEDLYQNQGKIQPFGYTGYQRDEVSGTYYAQAREYLAESGRFAGQDIMTGTVKYPETFNLYKYSFNQPLKYIDPSGETEEEFCENISTAFSRYGEQFIESVSSPQNWGLWALDGSFAALEVYKQITKHIPQFKTNANNKTLVNISDSVNYKGGRGGVRRISKAKLLQQDSSLGEAYRTQMKLDKLSKGLVCLNGAVSFISEYNSNPDLSVKEKIVNSSVEATWSIGSSVAIGSALGSLLPGAGTIVGAIGGFVVGTAASILIDGIAKTKWFDGGTKSVLDYVKQGVNKVVDGIGDAFSGFGEFVFG
ncbi:RHS repeat domain-containing protein, partial [Mediterraneibacter gnavus]